MGIIDVYLAATVLIAVRLQPAIISEISDSDIETSWRHALEILRDCQTDSQSAQLYVTALEILHEKLPSTSQQSQTQQLHLRREQLQSQDVVDTVDAQMQSEQGFQAIDPAGYPAPAERVHVFEEFAFLESVDMSWFNVIPYDV
jgi:hypothetical protein